jgi:acyl carrier protein
MKTREEILLIIKEIMVEMFEIDEHTITLNARLYEDLDFDSIDAIDMIVKLKEITGKAVKPEEFKSARSIHDVVEAIYNIQ